MPRPISDAWFHRVKAATRDLVTACGGVVRAGEIASASKSEVSRWQGATDEAILPLAAALALEADCGVPFVTTVMADLNGRRLTDAADTGEVGAIAQRHAETMRAASELLASAATALADGQLTPAEAEMVDRAASGLEATLAPLRRDLAAAKVVRLAGRT